MESSPPERHLLNKIIKENHLKSLEMDQQAYTKLRDLFNKFDGNL